MGVPSFKWMYIEGVENVSRGRVKISSWIKKPRVSGEIIEIS